MVDPLLAGFDMPVMIDFAASRIWSASTFGSIGGDVISVMSSGRAVGAVSSALLEVK